MKPIKPTLLTKTKEIYYFFYKALQLKRDDPGKSSPLKRNSSKQKIPYYAKASKGFSTRN